MKNYKPSLTNITPQIEYLTERKFSISHLAQLKFILPEAIELEKVLVHDEKTFGMKPDLHFMLNIGAINNNGDRKNDSMKPNLRNIFRTRVLDFIRARSEEEVPEGQLPEPFSRSKQFSIAARLSLTRHQLNQFYCHISNSSASERHDFRNKFLLSPMLNLSAKAITHERSSSRLPETPK